MSPFTVVIDGVPIQCETPEDALTLVRLHGGGEPAKRQGTRSRHAHSQPPQNTRWTDQRVSEFFGLIEGKKQLRLIEALLNTQDGRTDAQLLQMLGLASGMALAGMFAGLYKNAKKVGADPRELYIKKPITIGDKRGFEYTLSEGFRQTASRRAR